MAGKTTHIILRFGLLAATLLILLQLSQYSLFTVSFHTEIKLVVFASLFILFGFLTFHLISRYKSPAAEFKFNERKKWELGISDRELEVLRQIAGGNSNQEIADKLFISENTVKTHVSNLLLKLNAKRRTEAIKIARHIHLLP